MGTCFILGISDLIDVLSLIPILCSFNQYTILKQMTCVSSWDNNMFLGGLIYSVLSCITTPTISHIDWCCCRQGTVPDEAYMISAFGGPGFYLNHVLFACSFLLFVCTKYWVSLCFQMVEGASGRMPGFPAWRGNMVKLILWTQKRLCN